MIDPRDIREGMTVRDTSGRKLGTVANVGGTQFELGQGSPVRRDYVVHFHHVARVQGSELVLASGASHVTAEDDGPPRP